MTDVNNTVDPATEWDDAFGAWKSHVNNHPRKSWMRLDDDYARYVRFVSGVRLDVAYDPTNLRWRYTVSARDGRLLATGVGAAEYACKSNALRAAAPFRSGDFVCPHCGGRLVVDDVWTVVVSYDVDPADGRAKWWRSRPINKGDRTFDAAYVRCVSCGETVDFELDISTGFLARV